MTLSSSPSATLSHRALSTPPDRQQLRTGLVAAALLILAASLGSAQTTYYPRGNPIRDNGLDMNDDFVVGEPGVDDKVCDSFGGSSSSGRFMEDVDGDGVLEEQVFVDSVIGIDNGSCGLPGSPCRTISHALDNRIDGPGDGAEDIVCFSGVDVGGFQITTSGLPGIKVRPRNTQSSNEAQSFEYPSDPLLLMGWDKDDDGIYPPNDPGETARLYDRTDFQFRVSGVYDNVEVAHLESVEAGRNSHNNGGFFRQISGTGPLSHYYFHDIDIRRPNHRNCLNSGETLWSFFSFFPDWVAAEHINVEDGYGYVWRGGVTGSNVRFANWAVRLRALGGPNSTRNHAGTPCSELNATSGSNIMRIWANNTGDHNIEWIDSRFEIGGYDNAPTGAGIDPGITLTCFRELTWGGNLMRNFRGMPLMDLNDGICKTQSVRGRYWNNNTVLIDDTSLLRHGDFYNGAGWIGTGGGPQPSDVLDGLVQFNNNLIDYTNVTGTNGFVSSFIILQNTPTADMASATVEIRDNKFIGDCDRGNDWACMIEQQVHATALPTFRIRDNVVYNPFFDPATDSNRLMIDTVAPMGLLTPDSNNNRYYACRFRENAPNPASGTIYTTMSSWAGQVGEGNGSACGINIDPLQVFGDAFESGSLGGWSITTP